jgi:hypothetical protein
VTRPSQFQELAGKAVTLREVTISGTRAVILSGTPTVITQPSGVQQVTVTNLARPNVTVHMNVTVNEASNADAIVKQLSGQLQSEMNRLHQGGGADHGY